MSLRTSGRKLRSGASNPGKRSILARTSRGRPLKKLRSGGSRGKFHANGSRTAGINFLRSKKQPINSSFSGTGKGKPAGNLGSTMPGPCPNLQCGVFFEIDSYSLLELFWFGYGLSGTDATPPCRAPGCSYTPAAALSTISSVLQRCRNYIPPKAPCLIPSRTTL